MKWQPDGRMFAETLVARATATDAGIELRAPTVGLWRGCPAPGSLVTPGSAIGELEVLGALHRLLAPRDAAGIVLPRDNDERLARIAVDTATTLLTLDPEGTTATADPRTVTAASNDATGLVFRTPLSGRYYARPAPGEDPFVQVGDVIQEGQTVALLEVMKTFNRITYGGEGLPARAKVIAIVPTDEDDINEDDVIVQLETV